MSERMSDEQIRHALQVRLSGLQPKRDYEKGVWEAIGKPSLSKRCLPALLTALLLLMLAAAAAAGILLWQDCAEKAVHTEQRYGRFCEWNVIDKAALINGMVDLGLIPENDHTASLSDVSIAEEQRSILANQLLLSYLDHNPYIAAYETSYDGTIESVGTELLTFAVLGPSETWTAEQRAWWQQLTHLNLSSANDLVLAFPEEGDLSESEAIASARDALVRIMHIPDEQLTHAQTVADLYITDERPDYRRWLVTFNLLAQGSQQYVELSYEVFLDCHGNLIADADYGTVLLEEKAADLSTNQEISYPPILETYRSYAEEEGSYLVREWSLEAKAAYSREVRPQVQEALLNGRLSELQNPYSDQKSLHGEIIASTKYAYGLPSSDHLSADEARTLARQWLWLEHGLDIALCKEQYRYYEFFDCTDPNAPQWKFVFFPESFEGLTSVPVYKITLDAICGQKISASLLEWKEIFDQSPYHEVWY